MTKTTQQIIEEINESRHPKTGVVAITTDQWEEVIHKLHELERSVSAKTTMVNALTGRYNYPGVDRQAEETDYRHLKQLSITTDGLIQGLRHHLERSRADLDVREGLETMASAFKIISDKALEKQRLLLNVETQPQVINAQEQFTIHMVDEVKQ